MNLFETKESRIERQRREKQEQANELFQLREYDSQIWLTFNGSLVCPSEMLSIEPVEAVKKMRELYIERESV